MIAIAVVATSVLLSALVAWAVATVTTRRACRRRAADETNSRPRILCTACGRTYQGRADARDHARDAHDAPGGAAAVDEILEVVGDE